MHPIITHSVLHFPNGLSDCKLSEQLLEDGTAEELYTKIQIEKTALMQEGKIKKEKALPEIIEEDMPFDIPKNWKWVRLGEISWFQGGYAF